MLAPLTSANIHGVPRLRKMRFGAFVQAAPWPVRPESSAEW
jgi:hypothetical protein